MTGVEVIESFDNAWRALCRVYSKNPTESIRQALNMINRIISKVKGEVGVENKQFTICEWLQYLSEVTGNE